MIPCHWWPLSKNRERWGVPVPDLAGAVLDGAAGAGLHTHATLDAVIDARCHGLAVFELVDIHGAIFDTLTDSSTLVVVYLDGHIPRGGGKFLYHKALKGKMF